MAAKGSHGRYNSQLRKEKILTDEKTGLKITNSFGSFNPVSLFALNYKTFLMPCCCDN